MRPVPCLVIAGTSSGVGKTSIATALMGAYARRGLRVQGFKVGPDFIDTSFHTVATGRPSDNLDGWMLTRDVNLQIYSDAAADADLCIVEGVMGLFDGQSATTEHGSTSEMAKWLGAPVILVCDGAAMARSGAALVYGFETFDPELPIPGVLFNRVNSDGHFAYLRDSVLSRCRATPLGHLPQNSCIHLPERHLGLHLAPEVLTSELLGRLTAWIESAVDLDAAFALASRATGVTTAPRTLPGGKPAATRIAVARDAAFQFYYEENLIRLKMAGAELVEFSPIQDACLPDRLGGVYLGGGYPELHAAALAANHSMRSSLREFAHAGYPIYAECGGFMYLAEALIDREGREYQMCGLFPTKTRLQPHFAALGYVELQPFEKAAWLPDTQTLRGHEFRYSTMDEMPSQIERLYSVRRSNKAEVGGFFVGNTVASYFHVHFASCPEFAPAFVRAARQRRASSL